jgi:hypothetical protein
MAVNINVPSQVRTFANLAAFPASGAVKTIYIAEDTNKTYRWDGSTYVEISASAATGLTIGTTPIASGTIGRVLFQGTGNVLQQSSSLFWDGTNNRLGIGTSSPTTALMMQQDGGGFIRMVRNLSTTEFGIAITNVRLGLGSAGAVFSANEYEFRNSAGTSAFLTINGGNLLLGTTTDAGFKLDVNGTARVSGNTLLDSGIIATSTATTRLQGSLNYFTHNRIGSSGTHGFQISTLGTMTSFFRWSDATFDTEIGGSSSLVGALKFFTAGTEKTRITSGGNVLINTTTDAGFKLDVNGTARVQGNLQITTVNPTMNMQVAVNTQIVSLNMNATDGSARGGLSTNINTGEVRLLASFGGYFLTFFSNNSERMRIPTSGNVLINTTTDVASSKLTIESTTQGFLPPRMTTTQRNAIASPAAGLIVYDTTLNLPHFFNGTIWVSL